MDEVIVTQIPVIKESVEEVWEFSTLSDEEIKKYSEKLKKDVDQQIDILFKSNQKITRLKNKINKLRDVYIMPLLKGLLEDSENDYLFWPNREKQVLAFIEKVNKFVEED